MITNRADLQLAFEQFVFPDDLKIEPRYNIPPSAQVLIVPNDTGGQVTLAKWGLIPSWSRDPTVGNRLINARAETLAEKPSFRQALARRRCIVLADGFYEWRKNPGRSGKTPLFVHMKDGQPFAFAGLWERWRTPEGESIRTCTIITTAPNELMAGIHTRMPAILPDSGLSRWLSPEPLAPRETVKLLNPFPSDGMIAYPVSTAVNRTTNDTPACIVRLDGTAADPQTSIF